MNFELHAALARQTGHLITERTRPTHRPLREPRRTRVAATLRRAADRLDG